VGFSHSDGDEGAGGSGEEGHRPDRSGRIDEVDNTGHYEDGRETEGRNGILNKKILNRLLLDG
jgi:hypothetical protein